MVPFLSLDPPAGSDLLLRQAWLLNQDFLLRSFAMALCAPIIIAAVPTAMLIGAMLLYLTLDLILLYVCHMALKRQTKGLRFGVVVFAFLEVSGYVTIPLVVWNYGTPASQIIASVLIFTTFLHAILVRSHHLGICFVSLAPATCCAFMVMGPQLMGDNGRADLSDMTSLDFIAAFMTCLACMLYVTKATLDQHHRHVGMATSLDRARAANRAKDRFLSSMSHEIRTPLNGVLGIAQINRENARTPAEIELAETLLSSGQILKSMVDDILDHAKIEAEKLELFPVPTDLRQLCTGIVRLFAANAEEKELTLVVDIDDSVPPNILVDNVRLYQILANLVSNAVKFTPAGEVRVQARGQLDDQGSVALEISVSDTGCGLSDAEIAILFEAFVQVGDEARLASKGTGLGLPIARNLARLMGGDIVVRSAPGEGACFTVQLLTQAVADLPAEASFALPKPDADLTGVSVLIADDNRTNALILRTFLKGSGSTLQEVENGAQAVEAARNTRFDVILMDMRMPVMDGMTAFRTIRAEGNPVPIIALTANAMPEDRQRYLEAGMDGYLSKPLSKTALFRTLQAYCPPRSKSA